MSVKMRQAVEREIVTAVVRSLLQDGYTLVIDNGEDYTPANDEKSALAAMFATDQEHLYAIKGGMRRGWVFFVYGNDGWDVVNDYTTNLEPLMADANAIADKYA